MHCEQAFAMASDTHSLSLNSKFKSYSEFENAKKEYEESNNVQLWKRDARKIQNMQNRAPNKTYNKELVYGGIKLCCVHGGKEHKTTSTGMYRIIVYTRIYINFKLIH